MSNIKINDVFQRIQYAATAGQTQFAVPFPFFQNAYVYVWKNGVQLTIGGAPDEYTITGAGSPSGGLVTLNTAAALNDIITIQGEMPIDRTSIYSPTISNLTGSDLNGDFNREVVMMKQIETTQALLQLQYAPWTVISQDENNTTDRYIPLLEPLEAWRKNAAGTEIETFLTPDSPGLAPSDAEYLIQTANNNLPNAIALDEIASGFMINQIGVGLVATRLLEPVPNQTVVNNADGISGNPQVGIADNPILPGTAGMGIPSGTTAERVTPAGSSIGMRFNTDLQIIEAYIGGAWVEIPSSSAGLFLPLVGGTMAGNIDMDGNIINGLPLPSNNDDAANKQYVDNSVGGAAGGATNNIQWNNGGAFAGDPNFNTDGSGNVEIDGSLRADNILIDGNRISATSGLVELEDAELFNALDANSQSINNLAPPTASSDAATKGYVDSTAAGRYFVAPVRVSATANFAATYNNGADGIGATLTADENGEAAQDGVTLALNDRVLFPFQTDPIENGIYICTDLGSVSTPAIYTRADDYDTPSDIDPGDTVGVTEGTIYSGSFWMETAIVSDIGTDPITFILSVNPNMVTLNTAQTITGDKVFSGDNVVTGTIEVPTPLTDSQVTNKLYVDTSVGAIASFPSGTRMLFQQTAAPTGWTKDTTAAINNGALRTVTGSVMTGGTVNFTTAFTSRTPEGTIGNTTLTTGQIPAHTHSYTRPISANILFAGSNAINGGNYQSVTSGSAGSGNAHTHSFTGTAMNLAVKYYDVIIASKD